MSGKLHLPYAERSHYTRRIGSLLIFTTALEEVTKKEVFASA